MTISPRFIQVGPFKLTNRMLSPGRYYEDVWALPGGGFIGRQQLETWAAGHGWRVQTVMEGR